MSPPSFDRPPGPPGSDPESPHGASSPADAKRRSAPRTQFEYRAAQLDLRTTEPFAAIRPPPPLAPVQPTPRAA